MASIIVGVGARASDRGDSAGETPQGESRALPCLSPVAAWEPLVKGAGRTLVLRVNTQKRAWLYAHSPPLQWATHVAMCTVSMAGLLSLVARLLRY